MPERSKFIRGRLARVLRREHPSDVELENRVTDLVVAVRVICQESQLSWIRLQAALMSLPEAAMKSA